MGLRIEDDIDKLFGLLNDLKTSITNEELARKAQRRGIPFPYPNVTPPVGAFVCNGQAVSRVTYVDLLNVLTFTINITSMISGSAIVTVNDTSNLYVGEDIEGTGIPLSTTVASITDATHFVMSAKATISATSGTIKVFPYGNGDGSTSFNIPDQVTANRFIRAAGNNIKVGLIQTNTIKEHSHFVIVGDDGRFLGSVGGEDGGSHGVVMDNNGRSTTFKTDDVGDEETIPNSIAYLACMYY